MKDNSKDEMYISDKNIEKLATKLAKTFSINEEEAQEIIYEEWDFVESLFHTHQKVESVHEYLVDEVNYTYRIA